MKPNREKSLRERLCRIRSPGAQPTDQAQVSAAIRINFDDPQSDKTTGDLRIKDAWMFDEDVRSIVTNKNVLDLFSKLYGRRAFRFQYNTPTFSGQAVDGSTCAIWSQSAFANAAETDCVGGSGEAFC